jgi:hypothetical protein
MWVRDNGRGFNLESVAGGYGLQGMQERIAVFQGYLTIQTQPNLGCCIIAEIPFQLPTVNTQIAEREIKLPKLLNPSIEMSDWQPLNLDDWQLGSSWNDSDKLELSLDPTPDDSNIR